MQLTFLTSLVLAGAALTQASVLNHQRSYLHYSYKRGENSTFNDTGIANGAASPSLGTAVLPDTFTTLTVVATEVVTITSCAPTITSCPAAATDLASLPPEAVQTVLVTNTVVLTEVVCPVTLADAISSRVIEKHRTGGVSVVRTLPPGPVETGVVNGGVVVVTVTKVKTITTEKVLTLTLVEVGGFLGGAIGGQRGQLLITTTTETVLQTELEFQTSTGAALPEETAPVETATVTSAEAALPVETIEVVPPPPAVTNAAEAGSPVCPIVAAETVVETVVVTVTAEAGAPVGNNLIVTTTIFEKETVYMPAETVFVTVGGENGGRRGGGKKGGQKGGQRGGQRGGNGGRGRGGVEEEEEEDTPTSTSVSVPVAAETAAPVVAAPAVPDFTDGATCTDSVVTVTVKRRAARAAAPTVA